MKPLSQILVALVLVTGAARAGATPTGWEGITDDTTHPDTPVVNTGTACLDTTEFSTSDVTYRGARIAYLQRNAPPSQLELESNGRAFGIEDDAAGSTGPSGELVAACPLPSRGG